MKANEGEEFHFSDGTKASSTYELLDKVKEMSPEEFYAHVNEGKNDFHAWLNASVDSEVAQQVADVMEHRAFVEKLTGHHWEKEHREKHGY